MNKILNERLYKLIEPYLNEARKAPEPQDLTLFFNDNPTAKFFSVITNSNGEYDFALGEVNGHKVIKDINKNTKSKGCSIDANFNTMVYGNTFKVSFGSCGSITINNVIGLKVFKDENDLKSGSPMDSIELDHELDKSPTDLINDYYEQLKNLDIGDEIFFDSKYKYDADVIKKNNNSVMLELRKQGSKSQPVILTIDLSKNPFYDDNGNIMFKTVGVNRGEENNKFVFNILIKKVSFSTNNKPEPTAEPDAKPDAEPEDTLGTDADELQSDAKKAYDYILNDPNLKAAFYKAPSLWNLFMSELNGKKATGTGILATLQLVNKYRNKEISEKIGKQFIKHEIVSYTPIKPYSLGDIELKTDEKYSAKIIRNENGIELKHSKYKIYVRDEYPDKLDVFECEIVKYKKDVDEGNKFEVLLKFYNEGGYKSLKKNK